MQNLGTKRHTQIKMGGRTEDLLIKHAGIVRYIKAHRMRWIAHIVRMDTERPVKGITKRRPTAVRKIGRLRLG
jgi:hypothetical protein